MAIPFLFPPILINNKYYLDGGLSANLPVAPFSSSSLPLVGVHVNPLDVYDPTSGFASQLERFFHMAIRENVLRDKKNLDLFIEPEGLKKVGLFDTRKMDEIIAIGYEHAKRCISHFAENKDR
jgi:NTE family protein